MLKISIKHAIHFLIDEYHFWKGKRQYEKYAGECWQIYIQEAKQLATLTERERSDAGF